jgi:hypothetical protein
MKALRPTLGADRWLIGKSPDLGPLAGAEGGDRPQQCVDHHIFQSHDGTWHLWGCIRNTAIGRLLYHWSSPVLERDDWARTGEVLRADRAFGESLEQEGAEEWLQSPFFVKAAAEILMFYGGHSTGCEVSEHDPQRGGDRADCQICLMRSTDGLVWRRHDNGAHRSRVFVGPGEARDPCVVRTDDHWTIYYAGFDVAAGEDHPGIYARRSTDLVEWSEPRLVHRDLSPQFGPGRWDTECPFVAYRDGYYYLFRTQDYATARTHVFRSRDPFDFGIGDASAKYVGRLAVAAPEIIVHDGNELVSSCDRMTEGITLTRLVWVADD